MDDVKVTEPVVSVTPENTFSLIKSVITEDQQAKIIYLQDRVSGLQWLAGDLVNEIYYQAIANKIEVTVMDVCELISSEVYGEFTANTLRIYAAVARFYPVSSRSDFPDIIPFAIFRYAAGFGDDYNKVFLIVNKFLDTYGRPPYLRELKRLFEPMPDQSNQSTPPKFIVSEPLEVTAINAGSFPEFDAQSNIISSLLNQLAILIERETKPSRKAILSQIILLANKYLSEPE